MLLHVRLRELILSFTWKVLLLLLPLQHPPRRPQLLGALLIKGIMIIAFNNRLCNPSVADALVSAQFPQATIPMTFSPWLERWNHTRVLLRPVFLLSGLRQLNILTTSDHFQHAFMRFLCTISYIISTILFECKSSCKWRFSLDFLWNYTSWREDWKEWAHCGWANEANWELSRI